jgi:hypothetical protein
VKNIFVEQKKNQNGCRWTRFFGLESSHHFWVESKEAGLLLFENSGPGGIA